jgi:hypothetical protein
LAAWSLVFSLAYQSLVILTVRKHNYNTPQASVLRAAGLRQGGIFRQEDVAPDQ